MVESDTNTLIDLTASTPRSPTNACLLKLLLLGSLLRSRGIVLGNEVGVDNITTISLNGRYSSGRS